MPSYCASPAQLIKSIGALHAARAGNNAKARSRKVGAGAVRSKPIPRRCSVSATLIGAVVIHSGNSESWLQRPMGYL